MTNKPLSRRNFLKQGLLGAGAVGMMLAAGSGLYGIFGERNWIQTTKIHLTFGRYPLALAGVRIVQFSDTHIGSYYNIGHLAQLVDLLLQHEPDILCFTGDLFDSKVGRITDEVIPLLSQLQAPMGKFAVLGNHDMRMGSARIKTILEKSGFTVLVNESQRVKRGDGSIHVVGVDEMLHGRPDLPRALKDVSKDEFVLLLAHEPDFADIAWKYPVDLQLSGHSHGGQIRIPFYGSLFMPELGQKYSLGLYKFEGSDFHVYTNRGIGTTLFPIRFNCRPEISVFVLDSVHA
ncbi:metallophosphoesterase [Paenibacillus roseipurpureus]|uniref:Metallophosphoesterase n=1 Tax=Paenibacillus roseopurpureus TaxID=2918901 RepID=A0AA96LMF0_9BACL|nr:metallophosphoesterase [Paenibacillus sp. MBLB1832]WNR43782.1 metallophosphoesterase [Paenibacillus sp. MBLB1832]